MVESVGLLNRNILNKVSWVRIPFSGKKDMVELVDTLSLGLSGIFREGSNPSIRKG